MIRRRKSRLGKWIAFIIVLLLIIGAGMYFYSKRAPADYENVVAKTEDITTYYSFSGNVDVKNRQSVLSEKVMQISEIKVKEGDNVKKGDELLETTTGDIIEAKIDGEVSSVEVEENATVTAGIKLMEIVDFKNLNINVKVDEYDISALETGKEAIVTIGAIQKDIKGKIAKISKEGQIANGVTYFTATIDLNKDEKLRGGMSAEVKLVSASVKGAVTLPMSVIQFDNDNNPYVLKSGEKGRAVRTDIKTGINNGIAVEIKSGVSSGETVIYRNPAAQPDMGFGPPRRNNNESGRTTG